MNLKMTILLLILALPLNAEEMLTDLPTALTPAVSMLPLSVRLAPGSEAMMPLARALIGGMLVSTFFALFLVPCVYSVVKSRVGRSAT